MYRLRGIVRAILSVLEQRRSWRDERTEGRGMPDGTTAGNRRIGPARRTRFLNEGRYVADIARPRMLEAAVVRSPVGTRTI